MEGDSGGRSAAAMVTGRARSHSRPEIVGGSQREERLEVLRDKIKALDIDEKELWWYLELRKYGTATHSGFGLGFERLVLFTTGMGNIRDVIPFPRTPQNAEF